MSDWYGVRDAACPLSTRRRWGGGGRREGPSARAGAGGRVQAGARAAAHTVRLMRACCERRRRPGPRGAGCTVHEGEERRDD